MRTAVLALLFALIGVFAAEPALAHRTHSHVSVGFAFGYPYWGSPWWGPWGPWGWPGPYYYPATTVVVPAQPMTYIEKGGGSAPAPESWWYYCDASKGYYPYVKECPSGWQRVPPAPPPAK
jgi:hypothetical protein